MQKLGSLCIIHKQKLEMKMESCFRAMTVFGVVASKPGSRSAQKETLGMSSTGASGQLFSAAERHFKPETRSIERRRQLTLTEGGADYYTAMPNDHEAVREAVETAAGLVIGVDGKFSESAPIGFGKPMCADIANWVQHIHPV